MPLTPTQIASSNAIRATMDKNGRLKNVAACDAYRAACATSRDTHGEDIHQRILARALHTKASR